MGLGTDVRRCSPLRVRVSPAAVADAHAGLWLEPGCASAEDSGGPAVRSVGGAPRELDCRGARTWSAGSFELLRSDDLGGRWHARPVSWHGQPCDSGSLVSAPPINAWLSCNTGAIGGSGNSDKILLGTTHGGKTAHGVSA